MGVQYTRTGGKPVGGQSYRDMAREMQNIYEEEIQYVGQQAKDELNRYFRTVSTGRSWTPGPWGQGGTGDRVDTGDMKADLDVRVYRGQGIGLDVGWVHDFQEYYRYQDEGFEATGFRHPRLIGSDVVAGMGLIAHMNYWLRDKVDEALDRAGKRVVNGL